MEDLRLILLYVHIGIGFAVLFSGLFAMIFRKGSPKHNLSGLIYFWGMFLTCVTAIVLSIIRPNIFLLTISVFSFYMAFTGYRQTKIKTGKAKTIDHGVTLLTLLTAIGMLAYATLGFIAGGAQAAAIILSVFGGICLSMSVMDLKRYRKPQPEKTAWYFNHLTRMLGSYIAAVTAFSVNNFNEVLPPLVTWLGPTVIGTVGIFRTVAYHKKKLGVK